MLRGIMNKLKKNTSKNTTIDKTTQTDELYQINPEIFKDLTEYEKMEIHKYSHIYYYAPNVSKIKTILDEHANNNHNYDIRARYKCVVGDHIGYRYQIMDNIGRGSYGDVLLVHDHKYNNKKVIKIIKNDKYYHKQAKIEIKILNHINNNDIDKSNNVIHLIKSFIFRNHYCMVFNQMHKDLYYVIQKYYPTGMPTNIIKSYVVQLIQGLTFLRNNDIMHCDLKPENIMFVDVDLTRLVIIDFGSSCFIGDKISTYIQTRWYRSPEVILGYNIINHYIDTWSLGCIIYELYTGKVLFPGKNELEQISRFYILLGGPEIKFKHSCKKYSYFNKIPTLKHCYKNNYLDELELNNALFKDFLLSFLYWEPYNRITLEDALKHKWMTIT